MTASDRLDDVPIPAFIRELRAKIGHDELWLTGVTAVVTRGVGDDREVLIVRRSDNRRWTPVTGILEPGEEPAVAAEREVLEEASVVAVVERLAWVHTMLRPVVFANGDRARFLDLTFTCSYVSGEAAPGDDETTDARWVPVAEIERFIIDNEHRARIRAGLEEGPVTRFER